MTEQGIKNLRPAIEEAFENIANITPKSHAVRQQVQQTIELLNTGKLRVANRCDNGDWEVCEWAKKAVLLSFRVNDNYLMNSGDIKLQEDFNMDTEFGMGAEHKTSSGHINLSARYFDKVPSKFDNWTEKMFRESGIRVVPPAAVREGVYIGPNTVLMPSFVNIGAYVGAGSMVDTWATVGSCAQIGENVHLSGGVGIGGVLEPLQANPTIIEDGCFIGARSEVVEGVIVREGAVLAMGVYLSQSTRIYNRKTKTVSYGEVPAYSVVVPGTLPAADGSHSLDCAVIVKTVDAKTRSKTGINELLRD